MVDLLFELIVLIILSFGLVLDIVYILNRKTWYDSPIPNTVLDFVDFHIIFPFLSMSTKISSRDFFRYKYFLT